MGKYSLSRKAGLRMPKRGSGQEARMQRTSDADLPGVGSNAFPDTSSSHIKYAGGRDSDSWSPVDSNAVISDISQKFGVSKEDAEEMYAGMRSFTGASYSTIRRAQMDGDTDSFAGQRGVSAEKFINAGIKAGYGWNGGTTYRGIAVDDDTLQGLSEIPTGGNVNIHLGGSASWATKVQVSRDFADDNAYGSSTNRVVFVNLDRNLKGVSVAGISSSGYGEREVLATKNANFKKVAQRDIDGYTYIYVRNA